MFAEKHYPETIKPEDLDCYLAKGWYRMGQTIFTTHFLCFGRSYYSAIWVRLALEDYRFRKSLRKIIRKNQNEFRTEIGPGTINREKELLYKKYRQSFPGMLAPTLQDSLLDGEEINIYQTYEVSVYDENQLVALSYFDLGKESAASIIGIYDPDYKPYSLGIYTMLMEIDYCIQAGFQYFYPGYVVPGYPRFDYKLRIGEVDYFDLEDSQWKPFVHLSDDLIPLQKIEYHLNALYKYLQWHKVPCEKLYYPLFEANLFGFWHAPYFDYPVFLICSPRDNTNHFLIVVYNPSISAYQLLHCSLFDDLQFYFNESYTRSYDARFNFVKLMVVEEVLENCTEPSKMIHLLERQLSAGKWKQ